MDKDIAWLIQKIINEEIIRKFNHEDLEYLERLAWTYTQESERYVSVKDVMAATEKIKHELWVLQDEYWKLSNKR